MTEKAEHYRNPKITVIGIGLLATVTLIELAAILFLNDGFLTYTLDDPYIHLALGENIIKGHYGVNLTEFSAPSSSIIWPLLIAPFSSFEYFPFLINVIAASGTVFIFSRIIHSSFPESNEALIADFASVSMVALILATNIIGLIFTGMEHSLQVFCTSLIAYGLIIEAKAGAVRPWLSVATVIAPLIRYENMAVSAAVILYLLGGKYYRKSAVILIMIIALLGGFSLYLRSLGLNAFPSSVSVKSCVIGSGGRFQAIKENISKNISLRQGLVLLFGLPILVTFIIFSRSEKSRRLAASTACAIILHFIAGRFDWYNRYEIYIWSFFLLISIFCFGQPLLKLLGTETKKLKVRFALMFCCFLVIFCPQYLIGLFTLPVAANNIYEQHYQMHRFAVEYYGKPVAVNDIGYVCYKNRNYVLDLWGLASSEVFAERLKSTDNEWLDELTQKKNTRLVMIYDTWFKKLPDKWKKLGELHLGEARIIPSESKVAFYATDPKDYTEIKKKLNEFVQTLPGRVKFTFESDIQ